MSIESKSEARTAELEALDNGFMGHPKPLRSLFLPKCGNDFLTIVSVPYSYYLW